MDVLVFIQHNALVYIVAVSLISGIIATILYYIQNHVDNKKTRYCTKSRTSKKNKTSITHFMSTFTICFFAGLIPLALSIIYPYKDSATPISNPDGYLKLLFYDGSFGYRDYANQEHYSENDIVNPTYWAHFDDQISPLVYITISDQDGKSILDVKSEHVEEYLIGLKYGTYILNASCENYISYTVEITLTPDNKMVDTWEHNIYFIPDTYIATDIAIRLVDTQGNPYSSLEASIGIPGYILNEQTDEKGFFRSKFTLAKGEYLISISNEDLYGRFTINELIKDTQTIEVTLSRLSL